MVKPNWIYKIECFIFFENILLNPKKLGRTYFNKSVLVTFCSGNRWQVIVRLWRKSRQLEFDRQLYLSPPSTPNTHNSVVTWWVLFIYDKIRMYKETYKLVPYRI